jgi:hypothetical protein
MSVEPPPPDQEVSAEVLASELASTATRAQLGEWWLERAIPHLRAALLRVQAEARAEAYRDGWDGCVKYHVGWVPSKLSLPTRDRQAEKYAALRARASQR